MGIPIHSASALPPPSRATQTRDRTIPEGSICNLFPYSPGIRYLIRHLREDRNENRISPVCAICRNNLCNSWPSQLFTRALGIGLPFFEKKSASSLLNSSVNSIIGRCPQPRTVAILPLLIISKSRRKRGSGQIRSSDPRDRRTG